MNKDLHELQTLTHACLDGVATPEQSARLNALLRSDPVARDRYLELADAHSCMAVDEQLWLESPAPARSTAATSRARGTRWYQWLFARPLTAAMAGLMLGMLCTSMVLAYVVPSGAETLSILREGFEQGPAPLKSGVSRETGLWAGDFSELVPAQQGVHPESGSRMLRLLRADYSGKKNPGGYVADMHRLIDLRPFQHEFADGGAVLQFSAGFNAHAFPENEKYGGLMTVHALDAETVKNGALGDRQTLNAEALAMASSSRLKLDRDPATWQRVSAELRIPPNTEWILLHVGMTHATKPQQRPDFSGHYVDDVRVALLRRAPLP